jgi:hypothetical protein
MGALGTMLVWSSIGLAQACSVTRTINDLTSSPVREVSVTARLVRSAALDRRHRCRHRSCARGWRPAARGAQLLLLRLARGPRPGRRHLL